MTYFVVWSVDGEIRVEPFMGEGARAAAVALYRQLRTSWSEVYLLAPLPESHALLPEEHACIP